jgi:hypothetical protein
VAAHGDVMIQISKLSGESLMEAIELAQRATSLEHSYVNVLRKAGLR